MSHIPFVLRKSTKDDESFIYSSFLKSFRDSYPIKFVPNSLYFKPQSDIIEFLLSTAECLVACFPEDPEQIIGWCLFQPLSDTVAVHYLYIKNQHRNLHMGLDVIKEVIGEAKLIVASHMCDNYDKLKYKIPNCKVIYDPFLINKLRAINVPG